MLSIGVLPTLLVVWLASPVPKSRVRLERQRALRDRRQRDTLSLARLFTRDLLPATIQTSLVMGAYMVSYQAITFWYPRYLETLNHQRLPFLLALNVGGIAGTAIWGLVSETKLEIGRAS